MAAARSFQTPKGQVLESDGFREATQRTLGDGVLGTGEKFDSNDVASQVVELVFGELADEKGTNVETALAALGAMAGFSVQMAIREHFITTGKISEQQAFHTVQTKDGQTFYFGDMLNEGLVSPRAGQLSVWGFVGGAAQSLGAKELPDLDELFRHVASTVGAESFGLVRVPPQYMPHETPIALLDRFWNIIRNLLVISVDNPGSWPFLMGLAAQIAMLRAKGVIDPSIAARIVMESAVPMSKIDPARIYRAFFRG